MRGPGVIGGAVLLLLAGTLLLVRARPARGGPSTPLPATATPTPQKESGDGRPRWVARWFRPLPGLVAMSLAPGAKTIAALDERGRVVRLDSTSGRLLWRTPPLERVDRVLAAPGGQVLAWKRLAPGHPTLYILNGLTGAAGARLQRTRGAIWSVAVTSDGERALVGTGDRTVTAYGLGSVAAPPASHSVPGYPESLVAADSRAPVLCSTWLASGVSGLPAFAPAWRYEEPEAARWFDLQLSADGSTLLALSLSGPRSRPGAKDPWLLVWDAATGKELWRFRVPGIEPRARISANGERVALTYRRLARYGSEQTWERKITLFDRAGRRLFAEKGGAYLAPELVALSASGNRITVLDMDRSLCTLDRNGKTVARLPLPVDPQTRHPLSIRASETTPDGAFLLAYRSDGTLTLYEAVAE